jgi:hypothetical protein
VIDPDVAAVVEEYMCVVYGIRNITNLYEARLHLFQKLCSKEENRPPGKDQGHRPLLPATLPSSTPAKATENTLCSFFLEESQGRQTGGIWPCRPLMETESGEVENYTIDKHGNMKVRAEMSVNYT